MWKLYLLLSLQTSRLDCKVKAKGQGKKVLDAKKAIMRRRIHMRAPLKRTWHGTVTDARLLGIGCWSRCCPKANRVMRWPVEFVQGTVWWSDELDSSGSVGASPRPAAMLQCCSQESLSWKLHPAAAAPSCTQLHPAAPTAAQLQVLRLPWQLRSAEPWARAPAMSWPVSFQVGLYIALL